MSCLFDLGPGTLVAAGGSGRRLSELKRVFVSHLHSDHVLDLITLLQASNATPGWTREQPLELFGCHGTRRLRRPHLRSCSTERRPKASPVAVTELGSRTPAPIRRLDAGDGTHPPYAQQPRLPDRIRRQLRSSIRATRSKARAHTSRPRRLGLRLRVLVPPRLDDLRTRDRGRGRPHGPGRRGALPVVSPISIRRRSRPTSQRRRAPSIRARSSPRSTAPSSAVAAPTMLGAKARGNGGAAGPALGSPWSHFPVRLGLRAASGPHVGPFQPDHRTADSCYRQFRPRADADDAGGLRQQHPDIAGHYGFLGVGLGTTVGYAIVTTRGAAVQKRADRAGRRDGKLRRRAARLRLHHHAGVDRRRDAPAADGGIDLYPASVSIRSPGWRSPTLFSAAAAHPADYSGPARAAARMARGGDQPRRQAGPVLAPCRAADPRAVVARQLSSRCSPTPSAPMPRRGR